jgi:hypothetical protein
LLRLDTFDRPVVIRKGSVFVTAGTDRRSSGTHYTPRSLTEPIVQYTLEPLVYVGPAEGKPKEEWKLRSANELLDLKICDMACGSGAFLVQACRYLSVLLLEAWENEEKAAPGRTRIAPEGKRSEGDPTEKLLEGVEDREVDARRLVAQRCLYGVDKNPLAVEMAKLSLWLFTLAKAKPFEFLDHAIRCGDSLIGLHDVEQLKTYSLDKSGGFLWFSDRSLRDIVDEAISLRLKLEDLPSNTVEDVERQETLLKVASEKIARLRCAADLLVAGEFWSENAKDKAEQVRHNAVRSGHYVENGPTEEFEQVAAKERRGQLMFHWPLEFPEAIVNRSGFDAFVGNPPFTGGARVSRTSGDMYREHLVSIIADGRRGHADLCSYFFIRCMATLAPEGMLGLLATKSISQGDTRTVALSAIVETAKIIRAISSREWPGDATTQIALVYIRNGHWMGGAVLDDAIVSGISSHLLPDDGGSPSTLAANAGISFSGVKPYGEGFVLTREESSELIRSNAKNKEVVFPYIIGQDLNSRPDCSGSRCIIDFGGRTAEECKAYTECFEIVERRVKPYRLTVKEKQTRELWWKFQRQRPDLAEAISELPRVIAIALTSKTLSPAQINTNQVIDQSIIVIASSSHSLFACIASSIHYWWSLSYGNPMRTDARYSITKCFETYPFSKFTEELDCCGERYHESRRRFMLNNRTGLTSTYNCFHDSDETGNEIQKLRELHVEMDQAVATSYGWIGLDLGHGFHETKQGLRYTINESARREVLQRLLKLNHERRAEEEKQGLHDKNKPKKPLSGRARESSASTKEGPLFSNDDDEPGRAGDDDDAGAE